MKLLINLSIVFLCKPLLASDSCSGCDKAYHFVINCVYELTIVCLKIYEKRKGTIEG